MRNYLTFLSLLYFVVAISSAEDWKLKSRDEWFQIHKTCMEHYKLPKEMYEKAKVEKYPPKEVFEEVLCILRSVQVWDDTKGFSTDIFMIGLEDIAKRKNLSKNFLRESIDKCNDDNSQGSSPLEWAYRCFKCYKDNEQLFEAMRNVKFYKNDDEIEKE